MPAREEQHTDWPSDVPASSFAQLQTALLSDRLILGVAKDHAKDWWTFGAESRGRLFGSLFVYLPILIGIAVVVAAIWTQNWTWLIALPFGFLTMFFGSPMNPSRFLAVLFGAALLGTGLLAGWSSLVVSGIVVLAMYFQLQAHYGLGKAAFRRFLISDADGFAKYWNMGIVMLRDATTGRTFSHDTTDERLQRAEVQDPGQ